MEQTWNAVSLPLTLFLIPELGKNRHGKGVAPVLKGLPQEL